MQRERVLVNACFLEGQPQSLACQPAAVRMRVLTVGSAGLPYWFRLQRE